MNPVLIATVLVALYKLIVEKEQVKKYPTVKRYYRRRGQKRQRQNNNDSWDFWNDDPYEEMRGIKGDDWSGL